jgi:hypothetical protein
VNTNQGAIFIVSENNREKVLELKACYAYGRKKHRQQIIHLGEGLAG